MKGLTREAFEGGEEARCYERREEERGILQSGGDVRGESEGGRRGENNGCKKC
jgi:hypothetical protein